jgi:hypothetical protein
MEHNLYRVSQGPYERAWVPKDFIRSVYEPKKLPSIFYSALGLDDTMTIGIFQNLSAVVTHDLQDNYEQSLTS